MDIRERQTLAVLLNGFGEVLRVLLCEVRVAAFGRDLLRGAAIAGRLDLHGIKSERQGPDKAIVCDELLFLRQDRQHGFHIFLGTLERNGLRVLAALLLRQLLPEQLHQSVVVAIPLEARAGDALGICLRRQVIDFFQFCLILAALHGGRIADLRQLGGMGRGHQRHEQRQGDEKK